MTRQRQGHRSEAAQPEITQHSRGMRCASALTGTINRVLDADELLRGVAYLLILVGWLSPYSPSPSRGLRLFELNSQRTTIRFLAAIALANPWIQRIDHLDSRAFQAPAPSSRAGQTATILTWFLEVQDIELSSAI